MSFTSTIIVPLAAAGAGGESYYIARYTYSGSTTGAGANTSGTRSIVDLGDDTIGIWSKSNVYHTSDTRAQNYTRINSADGTLLTNKYRNYDSNGEYDGAQFSSALGVQFVAGRFDNGSSTVDAVAAFDRDGTQDGSYATTDITHYRPFAVHPTTGRIWYGNSDKLYGVTYTTGGGFAFFYEANYQQGGTWQSMFWQGDKLVGLVKKSNDGYINKYALNGTDTTVSTTTYTKQIPNSAINYNNLQKAPPMQIQSDGDDIVVISDESNKWRFWRFNDDASQGRQYNMDRTITYNSFTCYLDLRQVLIDQTRNTYVYSVGRFRWRPTWSGTDSNNRDRGSIIVLQHTFSTLALNKAILITLNTNLGVSGNDLGTDSGVGDDNAACCLLRNSDEDLFVTFYANKGRYNNKEDQELFVVKLPTDLSTLTLGTYNGYRFEDATSIINDNANPGTSDNNPYNRSYSLQTATAPAATNSSISAMSAITLSPTIVTI